MAFKIREHQGNTKGPCKLREARVECKLWNGTLWRKAAVFACKGDSFCGMRLKNHSEKNLKLPTKANYQKGKQRGKQIERHTLPT